MNAFQNLPMTRNGLFSHIVSPGGNTSNSNTNTTSSNNNNDTSTDKEEITSPQGIEVTNHFDAAAAISAALSRSHLADAASHQYTNHHTTLQLHNPWGNTPAIATNMPKGTMPKPVRRKNSKGAGNDTVYRKSFSGGSDEKRSGIPKPRRARRSSTDNEGVDYYNHTNESKSSKRERKRGSSFDIGEVVMTNFDSKTTLKDTSDQIDTSQRRRRTLPTPEEAAAEMLVNRTSFVSADELSFGSDSDANDLEKLLLGRSTKNKKKNDEWKEDNEFMNDLEIILKKKQKESVSGDVKVYKAGDRKDEEDAKKA